MSSQFFTNSSLSQQILSLVNKGQSKSVLLPKGRTFLQKPYFQSVKGYVADKKQVTDICRTCYRGIMNNYFIKLKDSNDKAISDIRKMLYEVSPNTDLDIYANPVMCKSCVTLLYTCYEFKTKCARTEEKLHKWVSQRNIVNKTDVNLLVLVQSCTEKNNSKIVTKDESYSSSPKPTPKVKKKFIYRVEFNKKQFATFVKPSVKSVLCQKCGHLVELRRVDGKCSKCGIIFNKRNRKPTTLDCKECGKKFKKAVNLESHKITNHIDTYKYLCCYCGKTFKLNYSYQKHRLSHETVKEKIITCVRCKKRFDNKLYLKHTSFCHRRRKFRCNICNVQYWKRQNFIYHFSSKHIRKNKRNCNICKLSFTCQLDYVRHLKDSHMYNEVLARKFLAHNYENVV